MIYPIILAGGSGTRLWPSSRASFPKQFSPLLGPESLYQQTLRRFFGPEFAAPKILTGENFRFLALEQAKSLGIENASVFIEPGGRNTAPAILTAALALEDEPDALMLVSPSDHAITDLPAFHAAVGVAAEAARAGRLVTFGVPPIRPETGYGYLELENPAGHDAAPVMQFVEKPDHDRATEMLTTGRHLWNAGLFMMRVRDIIAAFETHAPALMAPCRAALAESTSDLGFTRLGESYLGAEDISIDYAVMERAENISAVPLNAGWSDLGAWDMLWEVLEKDANGVALSGQSMAVDCENTLLRSEDPNQKLVGLGLRDIVAVAMRDAVLVADKSRAQDVKKIVQSLKAENAPQAVQYPRDYRPWGWFESLVVGGRFQVKRIVVTPGSSLSLQSHHHRSEHWIVVEGTARVTIGEEVKLVTENQSVYIPIGEVHRMENPGKVPMVLIEVQTGSYLGEDDIVRYEDIYART